MIPLLLLVIIAILVFGSAKVFGAFGAIIGAAISVVILTYVAMHYDLSGWTVIGIISVPVIGLIAFGIWDDIDKKRTTTKIDADGWEKFRDVMLIGNGSEEELLTRYPDWRKRRNAWHKLNKKNSNRT